MKNFAIAAMLLGTSLLASCSSEEPQAGSKPAGFDNWIEIQIALRSQPYKPNEEINSGDFKIVRSVMLPIPSEGGAGHTVCMNNGTIIEIEWDRAGPLPRAQKGVLFEGFSWTIRNALVENGDRRTFGWSGPTDKAVTVEFDYLGSPLSLGHTAEEIQKSPELVIRARWLEVGPKAPDIRLTE